jgi:hypothetical protein
VRVAGVLLLLSALALGIYGIDRSLWTDEAWVANSVMSSSLAGMFYYPSWLQTTPPLFLLFTRGVIDLFGPSNVAFRIVPLLLELLAVGCMAAVSSRLLSFPFALVTSALMVFHPTAIEYSRTCKQYSGEMAASTLILLCAALYLQDPVRRRFWWLVGAFVVALPLAWSSAFLLPGVTIAVLARGGFRRAGSLVLISGGVLAVLYLVLIRQNLSPELRTFWIRSGQHLSPGLLAVLILCVVAGVRFLWTRQGMQFVALLPCLLLAAADALHWYPVSQRTRLFALPCFLLIAAMTAQDLFVWLTSRLLKKRFSLPLADARGSVTASESMLAFPNRDCKGAARSLFQQSAGSVGALAWLIVIVIGSNAAWKQVRNHENQPIEDFAGAIPYLRQHVAPSDLLLVHASVIEGFRLYNEMEGWHRGAIYGETGWPCCRRGTATTQGASSEKAVAEDLRRMIPAGFSGKIWLFYSGRQTHWTWAGLDEGQLWRSLLSDRGCTPGDHRDLTNLTITEVHCVITQ